MAWARQARRAGWIAAGLVCARLAGAAPAAQVLTAATHGAAAEPRSAAVLIGGIHDGWRTLGAWVPLHEAAGRRVFGFTYDQKRTDLDTNARILAGALRDLQRE